MERGKEMEGLERKLEKMTKLNNALARKMKDMKSKHEQVMDLHNESIASILNPQGEDEKAQLAMLLQTNQRIIEENARLTIENQRLLEEQDMMSRSGVSRQLDVSRHSTRDYKSKLDEKGKEIEQLKKDLEEIKKAKGSGNHMNQQNHQMDDSLAFVLKPLGEYGDYMQDQKKGEEYAKKLEEERRAFEVKRKEFEESKRESDVMIKQLSMQNNKLLDENARLAVVHKQLAEELEIARNSSFSRMNLSGFNEKSAQVESLQKQLDQQNKMNNQLLSQMKELKSTYDQALQDKKPNANLSAGKVEEAAAQVKVLMETNRKLIEEISSLTEANRKLTEELEMQRSMSRSYLDMSMNMERLAEAERATKMLQEQKDVNSKLVSQMREIKVLQDNEVNANAIKNQEQVRKYEESIKKYEDQVNKLKSRVSELEHKSADDNLLAALQMNLDSKDRVLEQRKIELANQEELTESQQKRLREVEEQLKESSRRLKQAEIESKELNRKIKEYEGKFIEQDRQIKEFSKQIKDRDIQIAESTNQSKNERQQREQQLMQLQKELRQKEGVELLLEELKQRMLSGQRDQIEGNISNSEQKQQGQQSQQIEEMKQANQRLTQQVMALSSQNQQLISEMDDMRINGMNSSFMSRSYVSNTERDRDRERMDQLQEENRILAEELVAISKRQREELQAQQQGQQNMQNQFKLEAVSVLQNGQVEQAVNVIELQEQIERLLKVNRQLLSENLERGQKNADLREHISELNNSLQNMSFTSDHFIMGIQQNNNSRQAQQLMSANNQIDEDRNLLGSLQQELNSLGNNKDNNNKNLAQLDELMRQLESERAEERRLHSKEVAKLAEAVQEEQRKSLANHKKFEEEERNYNRDNASLKAEIIQLTQSNTVLFNSHKKYEELVSKLKGKVEELERKQVEQNQVTELKMQIALKDKEIEGLELKRKQLQSRLTECEEEVMEWQRKRKETEGEGKEMSRKIKELEGRVEEQINQIRELNGQVKQRDERIREKDGDLMELKSKCQNEREMKDQEMGRLSKELKRKEGVEMVLEELKQRMLERGSNQEDQEESAKREQHMQEMQRANERLTQQIMALSVQNQQLVSEMDEMRLNGCNNSSFMSRSYISNTERDRDRERMDQLQEENRILAEELVAISKKQRDHLLAEQQVQVEHTQVGQMQTFSAQLAGEQQSVGLYQQQQQPGVNVLELQEQIERLLKVNRQLLSENLDRGQKNADLREHISELNNSLQNISMSQDRHNIGNRASQQLICQNCMINNGNILDALQQQQQEGGNSNGIPQLEELRRQFEIEREEQIKVHREEIQKVREAADAEIKKLNDWKDDLEGQNRTFALDSSILRAELIQIQQQYAIEGDKERNELKASIRNYEEQLSRLASQVTEGYERQQIDANNLAMLQRDLDEKDKDIAQKNQLIGNLEEANKKEQKRIGELEEEARKLKVKVQEMEEESKKKLSLLVEQIDEQVKLQQALKEEIKEKEQRNAEKEAQSIEQQIRFRQEIQLKENEFARIQQELQSKEMIEIAFEEMKVTMENHQREAQEAGEQQQLEFLEIQKANQRFTEQIMALSSQNQQLMIEMDELRANGLNSSSSMSRSYISMSDRDRDRERIEQIQEENRILAAQLIAMSRKQRDDIAIQQNMQNQQAHQQDGQVVQVQEQVVKVEDLQVQIERLLEVNRQLLSQNQEKDRKHQADELNRSLQNMPITSEIFALGISQKNGNDSRQPKELMGANNNGVGVPDFENVLDSLHEVVQQSSIPQLEAVIKSLESERIEENERHKQELNELREQQDGEQKRLNEEHNEKIEEIEKGLNKEIEGFKVEIEKLAKEIELKTGEVVESKRLQEQNVLASQQKEEENQELKGKLVEMLGELEKMKETTEAKRLEYENQIIVLQTANETETAQKLKTLSDEYLHEIDSLKGQITVIYDQSAANLQENTLKYSAEIDSLSKRMDDLTLELSAKTKAIEDHVESKESMEKKIAQLQKDIIDKGQRFQEEVEQLSEKLQETELAGEEYTADKENELKQLLESKLNLETELELLKGEMKKAHEERGIQEEQMSRVQQEKKGLEENILGMQEKNNSLIEEKQGLEEMKSRLEAEIKEGLEKQASDQQKIQELVDIKGDLEKQLEDINGKNASAEKDIENMQKQNDKLVEEIVNLKEQISNFKDGNEELMGVNSQLNEKNSEMIESHEELKKSHAEISQSKEITEKENERMRSTLEDLTRNVEEAQGQYDEQKQLIEDLRDQIEGKEQELNEYKITAEKVLKEKQQEMMGQVEGIQTEKELIEASLKEKMSQQETDALRIQDLLKKIDDIRIEYQRDLEEKKAKLTEQFTEQIKTLLEKHQEELQLQEQAIQKAQTLAEQQIGLLSSEAKESLETQVNGLKENHKEQIHNLEEQHAGLVKELEASHVAKLQEIHDANQASREVVVQQFTAQINSTKDQLEQTKNALENITCLFVESEESKGALEDSVGQLTQTNRAIMQELQKIQDEKRIKEEELVEQIQRFQSYQEDKEKEMNEMKVELEGQFEIKKEEYEKNQNELNAKVQELEGQIQQQTQLSENSIRQTEEISKAHAEKIQAKETEIQELSQRVVDLTESIKELNRNNNLYAKTIPEKEQKLVELQGVISEFEKNLAEKEKTLKDLREDMKQQKIAFFEAGQSLQLLKIECEDLQKEKQTIIQTKNQDISEYQTIIAQNESIISDNEQIIAELNQELENRKDSYAIKETKITQRIKELEGLVEEAEGVRDKQIKIGEQQSQHIEVLVKQNKIKGSQLEEAERQLADVGKQMEMLKDQLVNREGQIERIKEEFNEEREKSKDELVKVKGERQEMVERLSKQEQENKVKMGDLVRYVDDQNGQLEEKLQQIKGKEKEIKELLGLIEKLNSKEDKGKDEVEEVKQGRASNKSIHNDNDNSNNSSGLVVPGQNQNTLSTQCLPSSFDGGQLRSDELNEKEKKSGELVEGGEVDDDVEEELKEYMTLISKQNADLERMMSLNEELKKQLEIVHAERIDMNSEMEKLKEDNGAIRQENEGRLHEKIEEIQRIAKENEQLVDKITELKEQIDKITAERIEYVKIGESAIAQITKDNEQLQATVSQINQEKAIYLQQFQVLQSTKENECLKQIAEVQQLYLSMKSSYDELVNEQKGAEEEKKRISEQIEQLRGMNEKLDQEKSDLNTRIVEIEGAFEGFKNKEFGMLEGENKELQEKIKEIQKVGQQGNSKLMVENEQLNDEKIKLVKEVDSLHAEIVRLQNENKKNQDERQEEVNRIKESNDRQSNDVKDKLEKEIITLKGEIEVSLESIEKLKEANQKLQGQIQTMEQEKVALLEENKQALERLKVDAENEKSNLIKEHKDNSESIIRNFELSKEELQVQSEKQLQEQKQTFEVEKEKLTVETVKASEQLNTLLAEKQTQTAELQAKIDELIKEKASLQEQLNAQKQIQDEQAKDQLHAQQLQLAAATVSLISEEINHNNKNEADEDAEEKRKHIERLEDRVKELESELSLRERSIQQLSTQNANLVSQTFELQGEIAKLHEEIELNRSSYSQNSSFVQEDSEDENANNNE